MIVGSIAVDVDDGMRFSSRHLEASLKVERLGMLSRVDDGHGFNTSLSLAVDCTCLI